MGVCRSQRCGDGLEGLTISGAFSGGSSTLLIIPANMKGYPLYIGDQKQQRRRGQCPNNPWIVGAHDSLGFVRRGKIPQPSSSLRVAICLGEIEEWESLSVEEGIEFVWRNHGTASAVESDDVISPWFDNPQSRP